MGALGLISQEVTPLPEVEKGQPWRAQWVGLETWAPAAGLAHARRGQPEGYVPILLAAAGLSEGNEGAGKPPSPGTCRDSCQLGAVCVCTIACACSASPGHCRPSAEDGSGSSGFNTQLSCI